ncbi:PREDICTED: DNA-directed RNA polymerase I subunit RPA43 isoform X2 [Miniopterus natalensis]|uniref:DNA-directed RNA polymerase I subunit RPA43 isoform X2 n=1 Tax=Miniopterus natalensis TaxID=291302 RepID=UPI0007A6E0FA|nr:PREDICTED: DNA-directed RNA polymerase I subunit RPA43 isoform X2 [Miniopterus natalensis]
MHRLLLWTAGLQGRGSTLGLLGVPIAYDNIKVVGELGDIYDDQGHIHLNIEADFIIFCPEPGQKLMGTVNKVSSSHIGCLVHGCFNASIPKPEQMPAEQWQTLEINVGDELEFEVFRLDSDAAGVFCIRGKLNITSLQTKCSAVSEEVTETGTEEAVEKPPKKKKRKKKDPELDEGDGGAPELAHSAEAAPKGDTGAQVAGNGNGLWEEEPKEERRKKRKKKGPELDEGDGGAPELAHSAEAAPEGDTGLQVADNGNGLWEDEPKEEKRKKRKQQQEDQDQDPVFHGSDSSGYQSDHKKKKKKRKHSEGAESTPLLEHSPKKKKRK